MNRHSAARGGQHRAARRANLMRRRSAAVVLGIVGVAGLGIASAAQLNVNSGSLGAGTGVVTSCQPAGTPITVSFTTAWAPTLTPAAYGATKVTLSGVSSDCGGKTYKIRILDGSGTAVAGLSDLTGSVPTGGGVVTSTLFAAIAVTSIGSVAVVISS